LELENKRLKGLLVYKRLDSGMLRMAAIELAGVGDGGSATTPDADPE